MRTRLLRQIAHLGPCLLPMLLILNGQIAHAEDWAAHPTAPIAAPTNLASAWSQASARDPLTAELSERLNQAQAGIDLANRLTPGPAAVSLNHLSDRFQQNQGRREWEVEVASPLWLPGQQSASAQQATRALSELQARLALRQLELAGEVREAWWQLAQARAARALAQQRVDSADALAQTVQRRFQSGDLARVDANLARTERLNAQAEALDTEAALLQAEQAYTALTGMPPPANLPAEPTGTEAGGNSMDHHADASAPALEAHPQWQALQSAVDLANSHLALLDRSRREAPELALRWTAQRGDALNPSYDRAVGIKLTVPLSSDDRVRQDSAGARAELTQADLALQRGRARLAQALQRAEAELATAQTQQDLAAQRRALTSDNLRLAQRAFDLGEQDLATLLRARSADHEAQAWLTRQSLAYQAAVSHRQQARGLLPQP